MLFGIMVGLVLWFLIPSIILAVRNYPDGLDYVASFANLNLPVMTFATLILIIATFQAQSRANYLSSVDAHFFELAKMHRDIFADIQHWKAGSRNVAPVHKGVEAMQLVSQQTVRTFDVVRHTVVDIEDESERTRLAMCLSSLLVYYGIGTASQMSAIKAAFSRYYPQRLNAIDASVQAIQASPDLTGYAMRRPTQTILGNYMRTLFHAVDFVDRQRNLSRHEKYRRIKSLRGLLSDAELIVFAFNAISPLGKAWMEENRRQGAFGGRTSLTYKYRLIKNLPLHEFPQEYLVQVFDPQKTSFEFDGSGF